MNLLELDRRRQAGYQDIGRSLSFDLADIANGPGTPEQKQQRTQARQSAFLRAKSEQDAATDELATGLRFDHPEMVGNPTAMPREQPSATPAPSARRMEVAPVRASEEIAQPQGAVWKAPVLPGADYSTAGQMQKPRDDALAKNGGVMVGGRFQALPGPTASLENDPVQRFDDPTAAGRANYLALNNRLGSDIRDFGQRQAEDNYDREVDRNTKMSVATDRHGQTHTKVERWPTLMRPPRSSRAPVTFDPPSAEG
jgi:hypothetical protein